MATIDSVKLPDNSTYDLTDNYSGYQTETLATPITVDGTSETTVEGALGAVNDYAGKIEGSMSNENLVDNPFFTINERGVTGGTIASYTPIVDRWRVDKGTGSPTWALGANGITLTPATGSYAYIYQYVRNATELNGKTVTISVKLADGTIVSATFVRTSGTNQSDTKNDVTMRFNSDEAIRIYANNGAEKTFRAVKLELGSISTLANDVAPDYALELAKCQTSTADPSDTYANQGQLMTSALQGVLGAVNLCPFECGSSTINGITYFVDSKNKTVSASGLPSTTYNSVFNIGKVTLPAGVYKLSGSPAGASASTYFLQAYNSNLTPALDVKVLTTEETLTLNAETTFDFRIIVIKNSAQISPAVVFKPMIRDARVAEDTYVPYAPTNHEAVSFRANGKVGAKNLWDIEGWLNRIGQAFTKSGDVYTIAISDTTTYNNLCTFSDKDIPVTISAPLTASGSMAFYVDLFDSNNQVVGGLSLSRSVFTGIGCKIRFNFNTTGTVTLTEPMIRIAEDTDETYQPFAMTNRQLTNEIKAINTSLSGLSVEVANGTFKNTQVDTYEDTGITFNALGAHLHVVLTSWISGKPTGLKVVATDNSDMVYETTGTYAECLVFANVETKTFRLYSKRGSIPSSPNSFTVKRINL